MIWKKSEKYAFKHIIGKSETYSYSQQAAEFIVNEIKKRPSQHYFKIKKSGWENKKKDNPRHMWMLSTIAPTPLWDTAFFLLKLSLESLYTLYLQFVKG